MTIRKIMAVLGAILVAATAGYATPAAAQATRTWVSGVGDDVNPCSRTAPCKTFAGAISKTAAGGEINCLDPGGFGAVTITKSMTISCPYTEGGALAGGNGITVNLPLSTDTVVIRGLDIFGVNPPTNGIRFVASGTLHIEDSVIRRFNAANSNGVSFQPSGTARLFITNTTLTQNGNGATGGGILIQPTGASGNAKVVMSNVRVLDNANSAIRIDTTGATNFAGVIASLDNVVLSGSSNGLSILQPGGASGATAFLTNSVVVQNSGIGVSTSGPGARILVGNTTIFANGTGVSIGTGQINSFGTNRVEANTVDGAFTGGILPQK